MNSTHNPDRFMADLRQILSQGRKRIGFLVGAGAPMSIRINNDRRLHAEGKPLIPGIEELTSIALADLSPEQRKAVDLLKERIGGNPTIENILSQLRLMERALGSEKMGGFDGAGYAELAKVICSSIGRVVGPQLPLDRCGYNELIGWISGTQRAHPIEIFTTNYDLLFEDSFEQVRAPYFDGFSGGHTPFFDPVSVACDDLPPRWSRLWKLHGSLGWALEGNAVVRGRGRTTTELVYPDHLKYDLTQKQPYSSLFERLKQFLLTPDTLLITTGFSYRDAHINAVLDEALAGNANSAIFAFQFQSLASEEPACALAYTRPNISVYAADGAVINGIKGNWRLGELPKNWDDIRASFWGSRWHGSEPQFLLGDFQRLARFCALAQAGDVFQQPQTIVVEASTEGRAEVAMEALV
ncbi:SIR2 family NAD-dependent protein deacylase [Methylorubrum sp. SL192]|uniref:SIR2 family NAD-dependent protein deacylase n=1 Tax=Methylorubrum sp. SL192 TaxID=2995167 RepID=UPI002276D2B2|nr:SIR2 family protein [Methylorubrum sp. SL192]MCY1644592.1 SIR2 family protein [Methylorubrum sp. SL192]